MRCRKLAEWVGGGGDDDGDDVDAAPSVAWARRDGGGSGAREWLHGSGDCSGACDADARELCDCDDVQWTAEAVSVLSWLWWWRRRWPMLPGQFDAEPNRVHVVCSLAAHLVN